MSDGFALDALLPFLGFTRSASDQPHDWDHVSDMLELSVVIGPNKWMQPSANFAGHYNDGRTMRFIEFSIGQTVASKEQALALIAYNLRNLPADRVPSWVAEGIALEDHLPWRQKQK